MRVVEEVIGSTSANNSYAWNLDDSTDKNWAKMDSKSRDNRTFFLEQEVMLARSCTRMRKSVCVHAHVWARARMHESVAERSARVINIEYFTY